MSQPVETQSAAEALEAVRRSREAVARRLSKGSWIYDLAYGTVVAGIVGAQAFDPPFGILITSLCIVGLVVMMRVWANLTGVSVTGLNPPRARWVAIALGVVMAFMIVGAAALHRDGRPVVLIVLLAVVAGVIAVAASRLWLKVFIAETRSGS